MKKTVNQQSDWKPILICCCIMIILLAVIYPVSAAMGAPDEVWNKTYGSSSPDYGYGVNVAKWGPITIVGSEGTDAYWETVDSLGTQWLNGTSNGNSTYYGVTDVPWESGVADAAIVMVGKRYANQISEPNVAIVRKVPWPLHTNPVNSFSVTYGPPVYYDAELKAVHNTYNPLQNDLFYVAAGHKSSASDAPSDAWLVEIGVGGGINWSRSYGGSNDDWINEFIQTSDGSFTLVGGTQSYGTGIPASPNLYLIRTDPNGNFVWEKTYGGPNSETGNDVLVTADGGYLIVGDTFASGDQSDIWLIRTDSSGNMVWNKTFGGSGADSGKALHNTTDGLGYVIVGSTSSFGNGTSDIWMMRVDTSGNEIWNRTFGGTGLDQGYDVDGFLDGYVISGSTKSFGAGGSDLWLIRTGPEKNITESSVNVVFPNGGEGYVRGQGYGIEWYYTGNPGQTVKIELLKGGVLDHVLNSSFTIGNGGIGYYYWEISPTQPIGDDYSIRISSNLYPAMNDTSDNPFSIMPFSGVVLQVPNGGEIWQRGGTYQINWTYYSSWGSTTAEIYLLKADQVVSTLTTIAPVGNNHVGTYCWTVPQSQIPGADYKIRVYTIPGGDHDDSNSTFTIASGGLPLTASTKIGVYKDGAWYLDNDGSGTWNAGDNVYSFGAPGWTSIIGNWNATGKSYIGVTNGQQWYLDWNGNGAWDNGVDKAYSFGAPGWKNVTADWNGDGKSEIGVMNGQQWYLDWNGNGAFDSGVDKAYSFGAPGWTPIVGDWNATGNSCIGVTNGQQWYLDNDGSGTWNVGDKAYSFGAPGWTPIVGDWNATGKSNIGVTNGQQWYLDWNGNGSWDGADKAYSFGAPGWIPVLGDWNSDGKTKIGVTNSHQWYLDSNGNGVWDNGIDYAYSFGAPKWIPVVGKWS